ncbi:MULTISPECIES: mobilome CxxCx(11)CxxC protein [Stenotrophomonas]|nr:mobilome CxxCx(11)CxxC protein [Stenotrophomonas maltophilia]AWB79011.1 hypothetical protein B7H26_14210 [Stenotrophomonas maltophilia]HDS1659219.1 hypothetical protein [Stenotrophomonas maltophilia]
MSRTLRAFVAMIAVRSMARSILKLPILQSDDRESREKKLLQIRMDALTAAFIYSRNLYWIAISSSSLVLGSILTPIFILLALSIPAGQAHREFFEVASQLSSAILLLWSVAALILKVEVKKEAFIAGRAANNFIASEVLKLLADPQQDLGWFITYVSRQDTVDQDNLGGLSERLRKKAYRQSLKQLFPGDASVVCGVCGLSPYKFKRGDCQLCGNKT